MFRLPDSLASNFTGHVSLKGAGSPYRETAFRDLSNPGQVVGMTGLDDDNTIEAKLRANDNIPVMSLSGEQVDWHFVPGRYFIGAAPIRQSTVDGNLVTFKELDPDLFPLVTGKNRPFALFHASWSQYTIKDIEYLHRIVKHRNNTPYADWAREQFLKVSNIIQKDLENHPHFADIRNQGGTSLSNAEWWGRFLARQFEKDYVEAQIVARKKLVIPNRHMQNTAFGGQQDFGGDHALQAGEDYLMKYLSETWTVGFDLATILMSIMPPGDGNRFAQAISTSTSKWSRDLIDRDQFYQLAISRHHLYPYYDLEELTMEDFKQLTRQEKVARRGSN